MPTFKSLYEVKLEDLTLDKFIEDGLSYYKEYSDFRLYIHNNVMEFYHLSSTRKNFIITTFTNGLIKDSSVNSFWHMPLDPIQNKDDLFNISVQKDTYDLDLDIIRYIESIITEVRKNFYDELNNLR